MIIGDGSIGKTCLLQRITDDNFTVDYRPTIMENFYPNIEHDGQNHRIRLIFQYKINKMKYFVLRLFGLKHALRIMKNLPRERAVREMGDW